ncbi:MAG: TRIC cation channel family protein [Novosphingobium sp.]|nr:TRIC cation channel family protein [Novosphingobium sp.]
MVMPTPDLPAMLGLLDLLGIGIFALSGAVLAAQMRQTFVTLAFFSLVTGVGGGSVRDLLIGAPVFWIHDPWVAPVCLGAAVIVWYAPSWLWGGQFLEWADAAGLAAYAVLGTAKALDYGVTPVTSALMGIVTGCVGGIIRDVLAGRPSILMRPELYVTAAALSACLCVAGTLIGFVEWMVWAISALAGFILRGAAIRWGLAIPSYGRGQ